MPGMAIWDLVRLNHINAIVDGYEATKEHFGDRLGFDLAQDIPDSDADTDACLMILGGTMFEFFAPKVIGEKGQGGLITRYGDLYTGFEMQVAPDVATARTSAVDHGMRILNDGGIWFFTHGSSSFGVAWEIFDGNFLNLHKPAEYWLNEHPMALTGLSHVSIAVNDLDAAVSRLVEICDAPLLDKVSRPRIAADGARLQVADMVVELQQPTGDGPVASYIEKYGERIRSTVWRSSDLSKVESYLTAQGFDIDPGDDEGAIGIPPAQNKNLLFQFTE
jgi:catechol 2,3-dioxygenase-like lactoylglutathione lyase family enzyme